MSTKHLHKGFLYQATSQKILLQQDLANPDGKWTLLKSVGEKSFADVVAKLLKLKFSPKSILTIYDYVVKGEKHIVSYTEVGKLIEFSDSKTLSFKWFTLKEISKLPLAPQTKQDIIVGRRVIDSQIRRDAGEQTIG